MSEHEQAFPVLPAEFTGQVLLKLAQTQYDELEVIYGEAQLADRAYEFVQSLR
jgi:hypothetical protein